MLWSLAPWFYVFTGETKECWLISLWPEVEGDDECSSCYMHVLLSFLWLCRRFSMVKTDTFGSLTLVSVVLCDAISSLCCNIKISLGILCVWADNRLRFWLLIYFNLSKREMNVEVLPLLYLSSLFKKSTAGSCGVCPLWALSTFKHLIKPSHSLKYPGG